MMLINGRSTMLDFLSELRLQIAWFLSFTIATVLSCYLAIYQSWAWWQWGLVGIAVVLLVPLIAILAHLCVEPRQNLVNKLLDDLIKQSRADTATYEEFLRKAEALAKRLAAKQPEADVPAALYDKREATVIYNNLPRILGLARHLRMRELLHDGAE